MALFTFARKPKQPQVAGGDARKVRTGTTYQAGKTALAQIPRPNVDTELGSSQPVNIREIVPELSTTFQRVNTYGRMMTDASVDVSVRAAKTPILGAEFFVEPYSDDPMDHFIAEFIWENLAKGMSAPFLNGMEDILHMIEDGYSVIEKVHENREWSPNAKGANTRSYTMLKKLGVRPAATIKEIEYDDNGGPVKVTQTVTTADGKTEEKEIDISKLMIFTYNKRGGDLTGRSILRTAYPHWYYKNHMYKLDAVQKERHGIGIPRGTLLQGSTEQDRAILRTLLRNIRTNEEAFIIQTATVGIDFANIEGELVDIISSADHHNQMIMLNVLAQFLVLGMGSAGGGRATAGSGSDIFMKSLKYVANYICQVFNMYCIPELVVWNFPTKNFPQLKVRNIGETRDLQMLGAALGNLFSQEALTPDLDTENWIRGVFDMPAKHLNAEVVTKPGEVAPVQSGDSQGPSATNGAGGTNGAGNGKGSIPAGAIRPGNVGKPPGAAQ